MNKNGTETEFLKDGYNVLLFPDYAGHELYHEPKPRNTPDGTQKIPGDLTLEKDTLEEFLNKILQEGGVIKKVIDLAYTTNPEAAIYIEDAVIKSVKALIVLKE